MIVSIFLLAIVTIGAASASENVTQEDAIATVDDSSDVLGDGSYWDEDFYITVQENYTQDKSDWDSRELIYISSYSQNNGTLSILIDEVEKESINIINGYFSVEDDGYGGTYNKYFKDIYPTDLGLDVGSYNVKVKYNKNTLIDSSLTLKEREDFDIFLQNPYYCEQEYWQSPSFIVIDSNHLNTGTLEIIVNGTRKISYAVINGSFEEIPDCSNKSRYLAPSDLLDGYGTYNIRITFAENGVTKTLKDETVVVDEFEPTTDPKLELYFDLYTVSIPEDNVAHIYLPREASGSLTISYNNVKNQSISYSKGYATHYMHSWDLNHLGGNEITVTYIGDDFGKLTATQSIIVVPGITAPNYVNVGEEFAITMCTHEWVSGNFNVYEYKNGKKGNLLATNKISNRYSTVKLSSDTPGLNKFYLEFDYPDGNYPLIQDVCVVENSDNVTVEVPSEVENGNSFNVTINAPAIDFTFAQLYIDEGEVEFLSMDSGKVIKTIQALGTGYHKIKVFYENGYYIDEKLVGDIYLNTFTVNVGVKTNITSHDVTTTYGLGENLTVILKDTSGRILATKDLLIAVNGENHTVTTDDNGIATLPVDLIPGNYVAEVCFSGSEGYLSSSATANVIVEKIATKLTADVNRTPSTESLVVKLTDINNNVLVGKDIIIGFDGSNNTIRTDDMGLAEMIIHKLPGNYSADISFAGDVIYSSYRSSIKFEILNKRGTELTAPGITTTYNVAKDLIITLKDVDGIILVEREVVVKLNNKDYNIKTDTNGQIRISVNLPAKTYTATVDFAGDDLYKASSKTVKVVVNKATPKLTASAKTFKVKAKTKKVTAKLMTNKNKVIKNTKVTLKINKKTYSARTSSKGVATFTVKLTKKGTYKAVFRYAGNSNYKAVSKTVNIKIK